MAVLVNKFYVSREGSRMSLIKKLPTACSRPCRGSERSSGLQRWPRRCVFTSLSLCFASTFYWVFRVLLSSCISFLHNLFLCVFYLTVVGSISSNTYFICYSLFVCVFVLDCVEIFLCPLKESDSQLNKSPSSSCSFSFLRSASLSKSSENGSISSDPLTPTDMFVRKFQAPSTPHDPVIETASSKLLPSTPDKKFDYKRFAALPASDGITKVRLCLLFKFYII